MDITEIQAGDLIHSKLHKSWCLIMSTAVVLVEKNIQPNKDLYIIRFEVLNLAEKKEYMIAIPGDRTLSQLRSYQFYRDGQQLL